jgi:ankyrin repeat protein
LMKTLNPNAICSIHRWKECTMPLYKTLEGWHQEVVEILIEARAEVNVPLLYGRTPLHFTAAMGQEHAALYLLRSGANTSIKDVFGVPPTMLCGTITFRH